MHDVSEYSSTYNFQFSDYILVQIGRSGKQSQRSSRSTWIWKVEIFFSYILFTKMPKFITLLFLCSLHSSKVFKGSWTVIYLKQNHCFPKLIILFYSFLCTISIRNGPHTKILIESLLNNHPYTYPCRIRAFFFWIFPTSFLMHKMNKTKTVQTQCIS